MCRSSVKNKKLGCPKALDGHGVPQMVSQPLSLRYSPNGRRPFSCGFNCELYARKIALNNFVLINGARPRTRGVDGRSR